MCDDVYGKFCELLEMSEKRIDVTNGMVQKLVDSLDGIKDLSKMTFDEYASHLEGLCNSRDQLIAQNKELLMLVESLRADLERERNWHHRDMEKERLRYDNLLESVIKIASGKGAANNINIK